MLGGRGAASSFREGSHVVVVVVDDDHPPEDVPPSPRRAVVGSFVSVVVGAHGAGCARAVVAVVVVAAVVVAVARSDAEKTRGGDRSPDVASRGGDGDGDVADPAPGEDRVHRRVVVRALAVLPQRGRDVRLHRIRPVQRELLHVRVPRFRFVIERRPARERWARARGRDDEREERRGGRARDAKLTWGSRRAAPAARGRHPRSVASRSTRAPRVEEVPALLRENASAQIRPPRA